MTMGNIPGAVPYGSDSNPNSSRWWMPSEKDGRHKRIIDWVRGVRSRQTHWRKRDLLHAHLYGNLPILGFGPNSYSRIEPDDGRLVMNIVKSKADTYVSMICRSEPEPMFLPTKSSPSTYWSLKKKADGLKRWSLGKLSECEFYDKVDPLCVLETCIFDYGVAKACIVGVEGDDWSNADVEIERAYHWEMVVDDCEALVGNPRSVAQRRWIDRWVAAETWPSKRSEILSCPKTFEEDEWGYDDTSDQILLTEIWHLPSKTGGKDGLHCIVCETATLQERQYKKDKFPFAFLRQTPAPWGIRGIPIAAQLRPVQVAINQFVMDFQDSMGMMARPKWLIPRQGHINRAYFDDNIGTLMEYDAPHEPKPLLAQSIPADAMEFLNWCWAKADEIIGISSYRSAGIVPSNLKSGKAQEVSNDTQDGRFLVSSKLHEAWVMDCVDMAIDLGREVAEHRKGYASRFQHKTYVEIVDFKTVDMKADEYDLKCYPASALANTPGARYDQLQDMFDRGLIDMPTFRHLLGFPDIEGELKILNAPEDLSGRLIERFLEAEDPNDPDVYLAPEPTWPLARLYERFLYATIDAQNDGAPEENLALMRRFRDQVESLAKQYGIALPGMPAPGQGPMNMTAPAPGPGMPPAGMPMPPAGPANSNGAPPGAAAA